MTSLTFKNNVRCLFWLFRGFLSSSLPPPSSPPLPLPPPSPACVCGCCASPNEQDVDLICRQYCALCLGNLACDPDNHAGIVAAGAVAACMDLMRTEDVESGR